MSLIATLALAASTTALGVTLPQCAWDKPGVNPFMGDVVAAVDRYQDIPAATRDKLKARMRTRSYDDIAVIERDTIKGKASYSPEIRDMHFGPGSVCRTVTRTRWTATMQERGLVYCEDGQCILVPTVCRNVSRVTRLAPPKAVAPAREANVASSQRETPAGPLEFEAPSAGPAGPVAAAAPGSFAETSGSALPTPAGEGPSFSLPGGTNPSPVSARSGPLPNIIDMGVPVLPPGRVRTTETRPGLNVEVPAIPEPSTWALFAAGVLVVLYRARRKSGAR